MWLRWNGNGRDRPWYIYKVILVCAPPLITNAWGIHVCAIITHCRLLTLPSWMCVYSKLSTNTGCDHHTYEHTMRSLQTLFRKLRPLLVGTRNNTTTTPPSLGFLHIHVCAITTMCIINFAVMNIAICWTNVNEHTHTHLGVLAIWTAKC